MEESNSELVYHMLPMLIECTENFSISFMNFIDGIKKQIMFPNCKLY